jgi:hypothetical protein
VGAGSMANKPVFKNCAGQEKTRFYVGYILKIRWFWFIMPGGEFGADFSSKHVIQGKGGSDPE